MPSGNYPARLMELLGPGSASLWGNAPSSAGPYRPAHSASVRAVRENSPLPLAQVAPMIARAIGRAVERTLAHDEMQDTTNGREFLADWLLETAQKFSKFGADVSDLIATAQALKKGKMK